MFGKKRKQQQELIKKIDLECEAKYQELKGQIELLEKANEELQDQLDLLELKIYFTATRGQKWDWDELNEKCYQIDEVARRNEQALAK